jgi:hypothetical protein
MQRMPALRGPVAGLPAEIPSSAALRVSKWRAEKGFLHWVNFCQRTAAEAIAAIATS